MAISPEKVAMAAGLTVPELTAMESTGEIPPMFKLEPSAQLLGLVPQKLQKIINGWEPDISLLPQMEYLYPIATEEDHYFANCYLFCDKATRQAGLVDTGWQAAPIIRLIDDNQFFLTDLFLTHHHEDHVGGLAELIQRWPEIKIHTSSASASAEQKNQPDQVIHLGKMQIAYRSTPGHSEDGATYVLSQPDTENPYIAFVGDSLFAGSMGRGFHSGTLLKQKVMEQIFSLPDNTVLCPGHGPMTTVGWEKEINPFFSF